MYHESLRSEFRVLMSVYKRCSGRPYLQLCVEGLLLEVVFYLLMFFQDLLINLFQIDPCYIFSHQLLFRI
jgi:hypothetical protein